MFLRILLFGLVFGCFSINGLASVPPVYRKAEAALKHYISNPSHNPIIHSLLNVFIHDKRARAFISAQAIELALKHVKELVQKTNTKDEKALRQLIHGITCKRNGKNCSPSSSKKTNRPTPELKQRIGLALDQIFDNSNSEDDGPIIEHYGNRK